MLAGMTASAGNAERNVFLEDANLQALLRRRAPWLTEEDAARLSELGAWTAGTFEGLCCKVRLVGDVSA